MSFPFIEALHWCSHPADEMRNRLAGSQCQDEVWLVAVELLGFFTPNETTFSTATYYIQATCTLQLDTVCHFYSECLIAFCAHRKFGYLQKGQLHSLITVTSEKYRM